MATPWSIRSCPAARRKSTVIKPGDRILKIDGASVDGLTLQQVADKLHGAAGSRVHLLVLRGDAKKTFSPRRQILILPGSLGAESAAGPADGSSACGLRPLPR